jgi:hypothetical protein
MKASAIILFVFLSCNDGTKPVPYTPEQPVADTIVITDTVIKHDTVYIAQPSAKVYNSSRFKNVTVEQVAENRILIKGQARVFEAAFNWAIEDDHNILQKGFETTDAGAPQWGSFAFVLTVNKSISSHPLRLILFEASAKDGSRQGVIVIPLAL